jgi:hypothetical protein
MNRGDGEGSTLISTNGDRGGRCLGVGFHLNASNAVGGTESHRFLKAVERELLSGGGDRRQAFYKP